MADCCEYHSVVPLERVYQEKDRKILEISRVINESGVKLSGVSYWSLTDGIDSNLERISMMYERGLLSEDEFSKLKKGIIEK